MRAFPALPLSRGGLSRWLQFFLPPGSSLSPFLVGGGAWPSSVSPLCLSPLTPHHCDGGQGGQRPPVQVAPCHPHLTHTGGFPREQVPRGTPKHPSLGAISPSMLQTAPCGLKPTGTTGTGGGPEFQPLIESFAIAFLPTLTASASAGVGGSPLSPALHSPPSLLSCPPPTGQRPPRTG